METPTAPLPPVEQEGSAFGRMFNVLAAPSEVFAEIKERPVEHSNWVIPAIIYSVIGIACVFLLFSQDWALYEVSKTQEKAMHEQVRRGKMKQEQADQALEMTKRFMPVVVKVGGSLGALVSAFACPFFWGFVIWIFGNKLFKADFEYMKAVEAAGLANIIYALAVLVSTLVSMVVGKLTYLSLAFFLPEFDFTNKLHFAMAAVNPFYLWFAAVIACAMAKLSGVSWIKAAACVFGLWIGFRAILIAVGLGQMVM
jgi:hypothetical protein